MPAATKEKVPHRGSRVESMAEYLRRRMQSRWKTNETGNGATLERQIALRRPANRFGYVRYLDDFPAVQITNHLG